MSYFFKKPRLSPEVSKKYEKAFESDEFKKLVREIKDANEKGGVRFHETRTGIGSGLVCDNGMPINTTAFLYCGEYGDDGDGDTDGNYYFSIDDGVGINGPGPNKTPLDLSFSNHSCSDFNLDYRRRTLKGHDGVVVIVGVTNRAIAPGEDMLSNYNNKKGECGYWNPYHILEKEDKSETSVLSRCLCNASNGGTCPFNFARWFRKPGHWKRKHAKSVDMLDESVTKMTRHAEAANTLFEFLNGLSETPISPTEPLKLLQGLLPVSSALTLPITVSAAICAAPPIAVSAAICAVPLIAVSPVIGAVPLIAVSPVVGAVPLIAVSPVVGAVPLIAVSAVVGAESALAIPDPGLSEKQIEPAHPPESKKRDMRGAHQAVRVANKTYASSAVFTTFWSSNAKTKTDELSKKYPGLKMPWDDLIQYAPSGNTLKVLWMTLYDFAHRNIITQVSKKDGDGCYGITGFTVQDAKEFNSGQFPTISHLLHQKHLQLKSSPEYERLEREYKRILKIWRSAGFDQSVDLDGIVTFTYDCELRSKMKTRKPTLQGDGGVGH
jgi:hypothetical protein